MIAIILAAGYGTRLYPLTKDTAKPLLSVGGQPLINYLIKKVEKTKKLDKIIIITNDKFFKDFSSWKASYRACKKIDIINDGTTSPEDRLGAVGDILFVIDKARINEDILVLGGDNFFEEPLNKFIDFCQRKKMQPVIGAFDIKNKVMADRFGIAQVDSKDKIIDFEEKPKNPKSTLAATCLYFFPKQKLSLLNEFAESGHSRDASGNFIKWLYKEDQVFCFIFKKKWFDIGHIDSYKEINNFLIGRNK
ncbi:MAG: nucleotidyltransferase family protein [Candidatus Omnitrophota bacterium]